LEPALQRLLDQRAIADVIYRYCRGIDRRDYELVRGCYHPDATDDHGDFKGGIDAFLEYIQAGLPRYERTMHFIGNVLIEPIGPDTARAESYLIAHHHLAASGTRPERDFNAWMRYVDDFERRDGEWRIAARVCAFDWSRVDVVDGAGWQPVERATCGQAFPHDVVYAPSLATWRD
jgi:hypothetical protein